MRKFSVEINFDTTSPFNPSPYHEVARILNTVARKLDESDFNSNYIHTFLLFDSNGNECGSASISKAESGTTRAHNTHLNA
jgi:hypothetical protein